MALAEDLDDAELLALAHDDLQQPEVVAEYARAAAATFDYHRAEH